MQIRAFAIPFTQAKLWQQHLNRTCCLGQLGAMGLRHRNPLCRVQNNRRQKPVVFVARVIGPFIRQGLPADNIHQIVTTRRNNLGCAVLACIGQPVRPRRDVGAVNMIAQFLRAKVKDTGKRPLPGETFKGAAAHPRGMKNGHLISAFFQRGLERDHIFERRCAKRGHTNHWLVRVGLLHRPRRAQHRTGGLAQRGFANRVETI